MSYCSINIFVILVITGFKAGPVVFVDMFANQLDHVSLYAAVEDYLVLHVFMSELKVIMSN